MRMRGLTSIFHYTYSTNSLCKYFHPLLPNRFDDLNRVDWNTCAAMHIQTMSALFLNDARR